MKEEPAKVIQSRGRKTKCVSNALAYFFAILPAPMVRDAQCCESKSSRGDARGRARIRTVCLAAIFHLAGVGIRFFPKKSEVRPLHLFQQSVLRRSELVFDGIAIVRTRVLVLNWTRSLFCWRLHVPQ